MDGCAGLLAILMQGALSALDGTVAHIALRDFTGVLLDHAAIPFPASCSPHNRPANMCKGHRKVSPIGIGTAPSRGAVP